MSTDSEPPNEDTSSDRDIIRLEGWKIYIAFNVHIVAATLLVLCFVLFITRHFAKNLKHCYRHSAQDKQLQLILEESDSDEGPRHTKRLQKTRDVEVQVCTTALQPVTQALEPRRSLAPRAFKVMLQPVPSAGADDLADHYSPSPPPRTPRFPVKRASEPENLAADLVQIRQPFVAKPQAPKRRENSVSFKESKINEQNEQASQATTAAYKLRSIAEVFPRANSIA